MAGVSENPAYGLLAGAVVGAGLVVAMAAAGYPPGPSGSPRSDLDGDSARLVAAWERHVGGTWLVEMRYTRTLDDGRKIEGTVSEAQRPPQRIRTSFGSVRAETADTQYLCSGSLDRTTTLSCRNNGRLPAYADRKATEVANVRALVEGPRRRYEVRAQQGCFHLTGLVAGGPWGNSARFCFDVATGALITTETRRDGGVDTYTAIEVNGDPPASTFNLPLSPS